jgi:hypothetical protein
VCVWVVASDVGALVTSSCVVGRTYNFCLQVVVVFVFVGHMVVLVDGGVCWVCGPGRLVAKLWGNG